MNEILTGLFGMAMAAGLVAVVDLAIYFLGESLKPRRVHRVAPSGNKTT